MALYTDFTVNDDIYLPFIQLGTAYGVEQIFAEALDDGVTGPIPIESTFPFGSFTQTQFYVWFIILVHSLILFLHSTGWN